MVDSGNNCKKSDQGRFLSVQGLCKSFNNRGSCIDILKRVNLDLNAGETLAIVGASGIGKSTLLYLLGALDRPDSGTYLFQGEDIFLFDNTRLAQFRNGSIGFIFQFYNLLPTLTALENIEAATEISTNPMDPKKALEIVKAKKLKLTAHFMESKAERDWLDSSSGDFKEFFKNLLKLNSAVSDSKDFLEYVYGQETLLTHAVKANDDELSTISSNKHTVIHCPISNRLLGNGAIDLTRLDKQNINWITATDGLSSNYKLDLFEEMKAALFMHSELPLLDLAKKLINSVTKNAAEALGLNTGEIAEGKNADMLVLDLNKEPNEELAIHLILHKYNISKIYINGEPVKD